VVDEKEETKKTLGQKLAAVAGLGASAFYLLNKVIPIVPFLGSLDVLLALGVGAVSLRVLGIRPLAMLKARKERKQLVGRAEGRGALKG
jgi:hypothetical protein